MTAPEYLPVCDSDDRVVGLAARRVVHAQGLRHRSVHVLVFNREGELFLQQRGPGKDTFPGAWDTSVGGHVDPGETPEQAVRREIHEELGLSGEPVLIGQLAASEATGWEFVTVWELVTDQTPRWDGVEITDGQWLELEAIEAHLTRGDLSVTPAFRQTLRLWQESRCAVRRP